METKHAEGDIMQVDPKRPETYDYTRPLHLSVAAAEAWEAALVASGSWVLAEPPTERDGEWDYKPAEHERVAKYRTEAAGRPLSVYIKTFRKEAGHFEPAAESALVLLSLHFRDGGFYDPTVVNLPAPEVFDDAVIREEVVLFMASLTEEQKRPVHGEGVSDEVDQAFRPPLFTPDEGHDPHSYPPEPDDRG